MMIILVIKKSKTIIYLKISLIYVFILKNYCDTINEINNQNIEINNKNDDNTSNKKMLYKSQFAEKEKNIKNSMSVILENAPEEEENDLFDGRGTVIQNNTGEEFDLTANIMNNIIECLIICLLIIILNKY